MADSILRAKCVRSSPAGLRINAGGCNSVGPLQPRVITPANRTAITGLGIIGVNATNRFAYSGRLIAPVFRCNLPRFESVGNHSTFREIVSRFHRMFPGSGRAARIWKRVRSPKNAVHFAHEGLQRPANCNGIGISEHSSFADLLDSEPARQRIHPTRSPTFPERNGTETRHSSFGIRLPCASVNKRK